MEQRIRVGAVSYLNTRPFIWGLEKSGLMDSISLVEDYPASIATQLQKGELDIALLPVAVIPKIQGARIVSNYCIGAEGTVASVAIFSEADRNALHVRYADEAVCIGPAASSQSYLKMDTIIEVAQKTGADAIHPGYGFLSENAEFADKVEKAGITFIGPTGDAMRTMGSKIGAKQAVEKFNVPMVRGTKEAIQDVQAAKKIAASIGYPILIKASAGGG
ncbi:MAG: hypothetical protein FGM61_08660, partial [Sediminibacterium sp.]|nr:hypothetical protein [Sediminibacterium sp.]